MTSAYFRGKFIKSNPLSGEEEENERAFHINKELLKCKMSSQSGRGKCIVQKLDFENVIVTNYKTATTGKKKVRARISREIEKIPENSQEQPSTSRAYTQRSTSPVLIKRCRDGGSPAFTKRKKKRYPERDAEESSEDLIIEGDYPSPGSPVFKLHKKPKTLNPDEEPQNLSVDMSDKDLVSSQENAGSSFQIEEFTQESKTSVSISSFESSDVKSESIYSVESDMIAVNTSCGDSSVESKPYSPRSSRRNHKKNSLLGRLHKLQQKRASEKLLWQHQKRKSSTTSVKYVVVSFWKKEPYYFIKCQSSLPEPETNLLLVDRRWVPNVKNVTEGSVLLLHPPWQRLHVEELAITVLLNLICVEVQEEIEEPVQQRKSIESVSPNKFQTDEKSFIDSLFSIGSTGLLW